MQPVSKVCLIDWSRRASRHCIRYKQDKQHEDDQKHDRPAGVSAKCATIVHNTFSSSRGSTCCESQLVASTCPIAGNKQEEQHEDDEKHNRPPSVSTEATVHCSTPSTFRRSSAYVHSKHLVSVFACITRYLGISRFPYHQRLQLQEHLCHTLHPDNLHDRQAEKCDFQPKPGVIP